MSMTNLTRYIPEIKIIDGYPYINMARSKRKAKSYVKFEEAVEASSNSLNQIKAGIAACIPELESLSNVYTRAHGIDLLIDKLRQLSAV